jgi:hypothetical protein
MSSQIFRIDQNGLVVMRIRAAPSGSEDIFHCLGVCFLPREKSVTL